MRLSFVFHLVIFIFFCSCNSDNSCGRDDAYDEITAEEVSKEFYVKSLEPLNQTSFTEAYRFSWMNAFDHKGYFTIGKTGDRFLLQIHAYSRVLDQYVTKEIELDTYEWEAFVDEVERINFWCTSYYSEATQLGDENTIVECNGYVLEGITNNRYHAVTWEFDESKNHLLSLVLKLSRIGSLEVKRLQRKEFEGRLSYHLLIEPFADTKELWLLHNEDTVKSENTYIKYIAVSVNKEDTIELENLTLIQFTYDGKVNKIPVTDMYLQMSR